MSTTNQQVLYPRVTFSALPDDVLLEIFNFYLVRPRSDHRHEDVDAWHTLVHVCKRWRCIVFASPHHLQLRLVCTNERPVKNMQDIWPKFPIVIRANLRWLGNPRNIIAALTKHKRVCEIDLSNIPDAFLESIQALKMAVEKPFSALSSLQLHSKEVQVSALPDSFLGGSAPRLQELFLYGIPFPALPKLLLSTPYLVVLGLWDIPSSGYISPEAMVTSLSALSRLESLILDSRPPLWAGQENRPLPRMTRAVLPALTSLVFRGDSEYLEDFVAQIDTPLLDKLHITFFNQLSFDTPLLRDFISRTETFREPHRADVCICTAGPYYHKQAEVRLSPRDGMDYHWILSLVVKCRPLDRQLSSLAQVCNSALSPLSTLEHLEVHLEVHDYQDHWEGDAENSQWVEILHPFTSVKDLVLHKKLIRLVAPVFEELAGESVTEVLPTIQNLFLSGPQPSEPVKKAILKFVAARELSGRPVAVHHGKEGNWQQMRLEVGD